MKILLDECLPLDFRRCFPGYEAHTAEWAGFKGKKNGDLIRSAESAGYEVLITLDQGIAYQQHLARHQISIVVVRSRTTQIEDLFPLAEPVLRALRTIRPGQIITVG